MAVRPTIEEYVDGAMMRAVYKNLSGGTIAGSIPSCPGVIEFGASLVQVRERLRMALEGWVELGLELGHPIPESDGIVLQC